MDRFDVDLQSQLAVGQNQTHHAAGIQKLGRFSHRQHLGWMNCTYEICECGVYLALE